MASPVESCEEIPKEESIQVDTDGNQPLKDDLLKETQNILSEMKELNLLSTETIQQFEQRSTFETFHNILNSSDAFFCLSTVFGCIRRKSDFIKSAKNYMHVVANCVIHDISIIVSLSNILSQRNYSLIQQEVLVDFAAYIVCHADAGIQCDALYVLMHSLYYIIFQQCVVDEDSSIYYALEFIRQILHYIPSPSLHLRFGLSRFILLFFPKSFHDSTFQKRSTSRTRVLNVLNELNLDILDLLAPRRIISRLPAKDFSALEIFSAFNKQFNEAPAMIAYILFIQDFPYINTPKVYTSSYYYECCCESILSLLLSSSTNTKQAGIGLTNYLLEQIPPHSYDLPICTYCYKMEEYFGYATTFAILCQLHYATFVLFSSVKEYEATYEKTKQLMIVRNISLLFSILTERKFFAFVISLLYLYLDEYDDLTKSNTNLPSIPMIQDILNNNTIPMENDKYIIHRGEAIMEAPQITKFTNSIISLNYDKSIVDSIISCYGQTSEPIEPPDHFATCLYTSYLSLLTTFVNLHIETMDNSINPEITHFLITISRLYMKILYILPEEITYLQLESVISMLKFFNFMVEKKYEEVVKYIQTNVVFLVNGLQRISTNLRENNQTVMMWYSDHTTITKDENYQYSNIMSIYYQLLSLISYSYGFVITV